MSKKIVVFYSRAHQNYVNGMIKTLEVGNTEVAAGMIKDLTGADIFKIQQAEPYSEDYNECIAQAQEHQRKDARPELKEYPKNLEQYDEIYLGFPNYWRTMPMAVFTFLEKYKLDGKVIKPFCTHEGSGMGNSVADIKKLCPNAIVEAPLAIQGGSVNRAKEKIEQWV